MTKLILAALLCAASLSAQLGTKKTLTLDAAKKIAAAAEAEAKKNNWTVVIAIVDDGANLIYLQKIDGTQVGSIDVAQAKAKAAVRYKRPTKAQEDALASGRHAVLALPGFMPVEGGLPILSGGEVIGGIGVSGVQSSQDGVVAAAGVSAANSMK